MKIQHFNITLYEMELLLLRIKENAKFPKQELQMTNINIHKAVQKELQRYDLHELQRKGSCGNSVDVFV